MRYLVVEDDENLAHLLQDGLQNSEITVEIAFDGRVALKKLRVEKFDLAIVDVMIPYIDGLSLINTMRLEHNLIPAIFLTAKDSLADRVHGFQAGGDDYLVKPFSLIELQVRINAVLRRVKAQVNEQYQVRDLVVDVRDQKVSLNAETIVLSQKEFSLLLLFLRSPDQLFDRNRILENVWGGTGFIDPNIVDQYVSYLRRKIDPAGEPSLIETVRGQGYRLNSGTS